MLMLVLMMLMRMLVMLMLMVIKGHFLHLNPLLQTAFGACDHYLDRSVSILFDFDPIWFCLQGNINTFVFG